MSNFTQTCEECSASECCISTPVFLYHIFCTKRSLHHIRNHLMRIFTKFGMRGRGQGKGIGMKFWEVNWGWRGCGGWGLADTRFHMTTGAATVHRSRPISHQNPVQIRKYATYETGDISSVCHQQSLHLWQDWETEQKALSAIAATHWLVKAILPLYLTHEQMEK